MDETSSYPRSECPNTTTVYEDNSYGRWDLINIPGHFTVKYSTTVRSRRTDHQLVGRVNIPEFLLFVSI